MGPRPGCSGLCPERNGLPSEVEVSTSITSHGYYRCSNASYGGHCPVGQRPNSTKVEGRACLMAGVCPGPENSPDPIGVPVNPGGHGYYRCSNASYGGRCPVGQRPNSTKVEGRCLPDGWHLPRPP